MTIAMSRDRISALCVHLLTASGAVFAMIALLEAVKEDWAVMFFWLVVAFAVDGHRRPPRPPLRRPARTRRSSTAC